MSADYGNGKMRKTIDYLKSEFDPAKLQEALIGTINVLLEEGYYSRRLKDLRVQAASGTPDGEKAVEILERMREQRGDRTQPWKNCPGRSEATLAILDPDDAWGPIDEALDKYPKGDGIDEAYASALRRLAELHAAIKNAA